MPRIDSAAPLLPFVPTLLTALLPAQNCVDQSYLPNPLTNGLEITMNQSVTQTFTVGRSGTLTRVQLAAISHFSGITQNPLTVDIVVCDAAGVPQPVSLAQVVVPPGNVPTSTGTLDIVLTNFGIPVTAGDVFGIAVTSPNGTGAQPSYAWSGEAPSTGYAAGQVFINGATGLAVWDLAFQTFVDDVATWTNYGTSHPGTNGGPSLLSSATPVLGTTPDLLVGNSSNGPTLGVLFFGLTQANAPTPLGGTALLVPVTGATLTFPSTSPVAVPFPIPNDPNLCGTDVFMQAVVVDGGASNGFSFSAGLRYSLGL